MVLAQRTGRFRHRLILLALTAITLLTVDLRSFGPAESAQRLVRDVLHPVTSVAASVFSPLGDAWNSAFNYDDLEAENAELRAEIEAVEGAAIRGEADIAAYHQLLDAVDLPYSGGVDTVVASVERGSVGNFASDVITIDKGRRHGIEPGMAVVTKAGLVGRVDRVDGVTSTVQLLSDPDLFVGVRLSTDDVGLGHAVPGEPGMFLVDQGPDWPEIADETLIPAVGSAVVTAAASRYPADVPIGRVVEVRAGADELAMDVLVELSNDIEDLHFVAILLIVKTDEPPLPEVVPSTSVPLDFDPSLLEAPIESEEGG